MAVPAHIKAWSASVKARERGDLDEAERQHRLWQQLLTQQGRDDAADKKQQEGPIDWDLVNREAAIGVELNRKAMTLWKKQQDNQRSSNKSDEQFNS
jgi:hypothetical protein